MKKTKKKYLLPTIVIVLMILSFLTGVLASEFLLVTRDNTPKTDINISVGGVSTVQAENRDVAILLDGAAVEGELLGGEQKATALNANTSHPMVITPLNDPSADVKDEEGIWSTQTEVEIFKVQYDNAEGKTTVASAYGDKVIAPGTEASYYFDVRNTGDTGVYYTVETESSVSFVYNGQEHKIPMYAKFRAEDEYMLGSAEKYEEMGGLDGLSRKGALSSGNYTRYTLDWMWPYEWGNDEYDTFLGNLAADGDELKVSVTIKVTAYEDVSAEGGNPETGDRGNVAIYACLFVVSLVILVILLFAAKDKDDSEEENEAQHPALKS